MNDFEEQIFGKEYSVVDSISNYNLDLACSSQNSSCSLTDNKAKLQNMKNCSEDGDEQDEERKILMPKRNLSFEIEVCYNQNVMQGKTCSTMQDSSESHDFLKTTPMKQKGMKAERNELRYQNLLQCPLCRGKKGIQTCYACRGQGNVKGADNFPRFCEYVMQFKLGLKESYESQNIKQLRKPFNDLYNSQQLSESIHKTITAKAPVCKNLKKSNFNFKEYMEKMDPKLKTHDHYKCDSCGIKPIVGSRFHCEQNQCQGNYDLCEQCYLTNGHHHEMKKIYQPNKDDPKFLAMEKILGKSGKRGLFGIPTYRKQIYSSIH